MDVGSPDLPPCMSRLRVLMSASAFGRLTYRVRARWLCCPSQRWITLAEPGVDHLGRAGTPRPERCIGAALRSAKPDPTGVTRAPHARILL